MNNTELSNQTVEEAKKEFDKAGSAISRLYALEDQMKQAEGFAQKAITELEFELGECLVESMLGATEDDKQVANDRANELRQDLAFLHRCIAETPLFMDALNRRYAGYCHVRNEADQTIKTLHSEGFAEVSLKSLFS